MNNFKKLSTNAIIFAVVYTFCMYRNQASIMFPVMMAAGLWLIYSISDNRKPFDNKISGFYNVVIALISISIFMTNDPKLIFMSKCIVLFLFICLCVEIFVDDSEWQDFHYIKGILKLCVSSIGNGLSYFSDGSKYRKEIKSDNPQETHKNENLIKVVRGLIFTVPLLLIIIPLMMSADVVFLNMIESVFDIDKINELLFEKINVVGLAFTIAISLLLFYGLQRFLIQSKNLVFTDREKNADAVSAITVTGVIGFVYGVFSFIQIRGILFSNVKLPDGYTYARYAREGFFQLFVLALINMAIVLICASRYEYNRILKCILYAMCAFTYVMIFSSAYKMILYIEVYNLTFLRIMVLWSLAVVAVIMIAVVRYVYRNDFSLFKFAAVVVTSFYIIVAFGRPDYMVAKYNLEIGNTQHIGWSYINRLSCDALPVVAKYNEEMYENNSGRIFRNAKEDYEQMSFRTFNLSVYIAGQKMNLH